MSYKPQGGLITNFNKVILPTGTTTEIAAANPDSGELIYNSTTAKIQATLNGTRNALFDETDRKYLVTGNAKFTAVASAGTITLTLQEDINNTTPSLNFPVWVYNRHETADTAEIVGNQLTGAFTLSIAGTNTFGFASGAVARIYVYLVLKSGSYSLAVSAFKFGSETYRNISAIGGGTSGFVIYGTSLTSASIRLIGFFEAVNTAGSWASPTAAMIMQEQMYQPRFRETLDVFNTEFTSSAAADTYEDVTGLSLTVKPGFWFIGYTIPFYMTSTGTLTNYTANWAMSDSTNNNLTGFLTSATMSLGTNITTYSGVVTCIYPTLFTSTDTWKIRTRRSSTSLGVITIGSNSNVTASLTQPDNSGGHFFAYRLEA